MIELGPLAILRPWWLAALPAIAVVLYLLSRRLTGLSAWDRAIDPLLMQALRQMGATVPGSPGSRWIAAAIAAIIAIALAGPSTRTGDLTAFRNLDGLVIAIDLSRSVTEGRSLSTALTSARLVADNAGSRPVALIAYGQDAYEASGFTIDTRVLGTTIALLDSETVPGAGSRPERALSLARKMLDESRTLAGDIVLVSDGGGLDTEAMSEAKSIAARGARVSALFVPSTTNPEAPPADRNSLAELVRNGRGVIADVNFPEQVLAQAGVSTSTRLAATDYAVLAWNDHGRLLLLLAMIAALPLFRRTA